MQSTEKTFWSKVEPSGFCWEWTGPKGATGYGWASVNGKRTTAHRQSYMFLVGDIPEGLHLDHLCRHRSCVNPDHLEPVTPQENSRRAIKPQRGMCPHGHEYTAENMLNVGSGKYRQPKRCRQCVLVRAHLERGLECSVAALCSSESHAGPIRQRTATECKWGHSLHDAYVRENGGLRCRTCTKARTSQKVNGGKP